jgi:hypothetical protein
MAYSFGSLVFTPTIKAMQERYGSRPAYANRETSAFVAELDVSISSTVLVVESVRNTVLPSGESAIPPSTADGKTNVPCCIPVAATIAITTPPLLP